jgi:glucose-6-phosphate 1-dehydrogenase
MGKQVEPHILIIYGASGDLAQRKLLPAVFRLYQGGFLPREFALLGVSRTAFTDEEFRRKVVYDNEYLLDDVEDEAQKEAFAQHLFYLDISSYTNDDDVVMLKQKLQELDRQEKTQGNHIFYLSVPPKLYTAIPEALAKQGLNEQTHGWNRLVIEKPFGYDEDSAKELNQFLLGLYEEDQLYRIDHYLGKETVQNLLVTRFANGIFEPLWNNHYIHSVQITASETVGVGSRGGYYDNSGALRDMVQNHLMQIVAHVAMEPPISADAKSIRDEKLKLFRSIRPIDKSEIEKYVVRGQYEAAQMIDGTEMIGYREAEGVPPDSKTETFVALKFYIDNWRWAGVPFFVRTGKALPLKVTEVVITFKRPPQPLFSDFGEEVDCNNQLIMRIQPHEGLALQFGMKVPGDGFRVKNVHMDFFYSDLTKAYVPEAYERLLLDCMKGDPTLYSRGDSVVAAWSFVDPILEAWENHPDICLHGYPAGCWGPPAADRLWEPEGGSWRNPANALTESKHYSEL